MDEFYALLENLKSLYEAELFEDVKILSDLLIGMSESPNIQISLESKDKYILYNLYGNAAFYLKDYKLAESLLNKALQISRSKAKASSVLKIYFNIFFLKILSSIFKKDDESDIKMKFNLHLCLMNDKKYQEAFIIVSLSLLILLKFSLL